MVAYISSKFGEFLLINGWDLSVHFHPLSVFVVLCSHRGHWTDLTKTSPHVWQ